MIRRALATAVLVIAAQAAARSEKGGPKATEPTQTLKPAEGEGYFDGVFGLDDGGKRLAVLRSDSATFTKLEIYDLATTPPKRTSSFDLPNNLLVASRIELLPPGKGVVLIARAQPDDAAPLYAYLFDENGKPGAKVGPATAFARPPADGTARAGLLVAFDRKLGGHGAEATYTVSPFSLATLAPAGKPRAYHTDVAGDLKTPPVRVIGFYDGYTRLLGERLGAYDKAADVREPPRKVVIDALSGKILEETEISDVVGWAVTGQLRRDNPGQALFVDLNQDGSGVDMIDAMGKKMPADLAVPFRFYDPKTLVVEEVTVPNRLTFGMGVDPLNPDAIKRKKADLPMLDVYAADLADGTVKLRGRVFTPRPVTFRTRADKLVVLKRFKSFARGGDELQIFDLR
ncbi:MAG TPA: hypothetical protein VFG23_23605 [Polyangia bacterium]|nr:hypothetical protein [Polyangia bacterium]